MRSLAGDESPALNHKPNGVAVNGTAKATCTVARATETVKGCRDRMSEAEYQRLVDLGHKHHRRQRRRNRR